jgi:hypothetical protein
MPAKSFQLTLAAAAKRLSDVYGDGASVINATNDIPYRQLLLSAEGAAAFIGADSSVTSTTYGTRVEVGAASSYNVEIGPFETGPIKLSSLWAAGAGSTLHILGIPY